MSWWRCEFRKLQFKQCYYAPLHVSVRISKLYMLNVKLLEKTISNIKICVFWVLINLVLKFLSLSDRDNLRNIWATWGLSEQSKGYSDKRKSTLGNLLKSAVKNTLFSQIHISPGGTWLHLESISWNYVKVTVQCTNSKKYTSGKSVWLRGHFHFRWQYLHDNSSRSLISDIAISH